MLWLENKQSFLSSVRLQNWFLKISRTPPEQLCRVQRVGVHALVWFVLGTPQKMTIKNFLIEYDAINRRNTFTNGDTINGRIILEVDKKTRIQSLVFMAKGKASACWTQHYRHDRSNVWFSDEKYYSIKQDILKEAKENGNVWC